MEQDSQERIEELENKVEELENKVEELENKVEELENKCSTNSGSAYDLYHKLRMIRDQADTAADEVDEICDNLDV